MHDVQLVQDPARTAVYFLEPFLKEPPTTAIMIIIVVEKIQGTGSVFTRGRNVQVVPLPYVPIDENHNRHLHQVSVFIKKPLLDSFESSGQEKKYALEKNY